MDFKEVWLAECERRTSELEDAGLPHAETAARAELEAYGLAVDRLAAQADYYRQRVKDEAP